MRLHPWHEIPPGDDMPDEFRTVVEVPRKDTTKYELDKELGILRIDRILHPPVPYPANYGFIPQTLDEDGDPLDVLVLMQNRVAPMTVLQARPIGLISLTDRDKNDDKVICVHVDDPMYAEATSVEDLPDYKVKEVTWFFEDYKDIMEREVEVDGFLGPEAAKESIRRCRDFYLEEFPEQA